MKYTIVSGSLQENSQSLKVSRYIADRLESYEETEQVFLIDLQQQPLMFWDVSFWSGDAKWNAVWNDKKQQLQQSDSLILVTPEYNGMATPNLKNFLLLVTPEEVGHKPALIVSVSASGGGSYCINELRASGYKNTKLCYIPEHLIIRDVNKVLNDSSDQNDERKHAYIEKRIAYTLKVLELYGKTFQKLRSNKDILVHKDFPFGM
ncbi:NADPH azoreductase [Spirochaetota bacterium]|nr:NADPH azoreductase [Spirochaetota bacterium]